MPTKPRKPTMPATRTVPGKDRNAEAAVLPKTIDAAGPKPAAAKAVLPPGVAVVDGYKVYQSTVEPVHITREQIARAIASVK